jgi:hypothetical protein
MRYCDCPTCPCNVPVESTRRGRSSALGGGKDCRECRAGNHLVVSRGELVRHQPEGGE